MARKKTTDGTNKSEFIRSVLREKPGAKLADVNAAWATAGHDGEITSALYYNVKGAMKKKGKRGRPSKQESEDGAAAPSSADVYAAIERGLDELVMKAEDLKDRGLADAIRIARRKASAKLV